MKQHENVFSPFFPLLFINNEQQCRLRLHPAAVIDKIITSLQMLLFWDKQVRLSHPCRGVLIIVTRVLGL